MILKTINDTTLINSETFNYDNRGRLLEQISINKEQNNQAYDTTRYRNMYSDTLENGINVTYTYRYNAINSVEESLYSIEKITNDSIGRVKFSELIYPTKDDKFVVEFLYSKKDSNVGTKTYVNDSLVYNSEIDTLIYEDTCIVEYFKDIEPTQTKSEIENILMKSLKGLRNELNKPYKCGEKHIIIYSPDSRRSIRIEYSGSDYGKKQLINYSYTMIFEEK